MNTEQPSPRAKPGNRGAGMGTLLGLPLGVVCGLTLLAFASGPMASLLPSSVDVTDPFDTISPAHPLRVPWPDPRAAIAEGDFTELGRQLFQLRRGAHGNGQTNYLVEKDEQTPCYYPNADTLGQWLAVLQQSTGYSAYGKDRKALATGLVEIARVLDARVSDTSELRSAAEVARSMAEELRETDGPAAEAFVNALEGLALSGVNHSGIESAVLQRRRLPLWEGI
ncbi:MAG: hypothetical protein CSB44_02965 [Gammaproteobacteria bacterium]|nr:MAG: hypothetical protein CSB44_02965 [Gammaproteobacteria bacterium]